jgi:hypothetical protein
MLVVKRYYCCGISTILYLEKKSVCVSVLHCSLQDYCNDFVYLNDYEF